MGSLAVKFAANTWCVPVAYLNKCWCLQRVDLLGGQEQDNVLRVCSDFANTNFSITGILCVVEIAVTVNFIQLHPGV